MVFWPSAYQEICCCTRHGPFYGTDRALLFNHVAFSYTLTDVQFPDKGFPPRSTSGDIPNSHTPHLNPQLKGSMHVACQRWEFISASKSKRLDIVQFAYLASNGDGVA